MKGKMRKILVAFLALILVLNLAACGGGSSEEAAGGEAEADKVIKVAALIRRQPKAHHQMREPEILVLKHQLRVV